MGIFHQPVKKSEIGFDLPDNLKFSNNYFLKSTRGHFGKVCSIAISNPWVAIIL